MQKYMGSLNRSYRNIRRIWEMKSARFILPNNTKDTFPRRFNFRQVLVSENMCLQRPVIHSSSSNKSIEVAVFVSKSFSVVVGEETLVIWWYNTKKKLGRSSRDHVWRCWCAKLSHNCSLVWLVFGMAQQWKSWDYWAIWSIADIPYEDLPGDLGIEGPWGTVFTKFPIRPSELPFDWTCFCNFSWIHYQSFLG